jgi:hypothetical protein
MIELKQAIWFTSKQKEIKPKKTTQKGRQDKVNISITLSR